MSKPKPIRYVRISENDPENSVSLFDKARTNEFGRMYCIAPDILEHEVDFYWNLYLKQEFPELTKKEINRYHYILYFDHDGNEKAREAVDKIREGLDDLLYQHGEHLLRAEFEFDCIEEITNEYE